jgi:twitching motility protein PilT
MERILKAAVDRGATDLHIKAGDVFRARINGRLVPLTKQALTPEQTKAIALRLIPTEEHRARIDKLTDYDCSWGASGIGRFRVNLLRQRSSFMIVMRVIPFEVPTLDGLGLPPATARLAALEQGLVLVTGGPGSGKTSTIAGLVQRINATRNAHIVTLEAPLEILHRDLQSSVTQREVGVDTPSFREGLAAAMRQDPDVIVVGDLRDAETVETALSAAERGHLVIGGFYAPDAAGTILRLLAMFPPEEQDVLRVRLAEALHDGAGRTAAVELLFGTPEIRAVLRDGTRLGELRTAIADAHGSHDTQTFDQHLVELVRTGRVAFATAVAASNDPAGFEAAHAELRHVPMPEPVVVQTATPTPLDTMALDEMLDDAGRPDSGADSR